MHSAACDTAAISLQVDPVSHRRMNQRERGTSPSMTTAACTSWTARAEQLVSRQGIGSEDQDGRAPGSAITF